mmetsp:Transcript_13024/g.26023  ORF Transcript_13024/g.26023 Transcript_13024/m.26023 type:complete len:322 (-) Transcript_13024:47-1012(-)|eukprot:CAMPEP_0181289894 /NCGR_PEP_ID=MMETSP1101-20121128/1126_1 /TAXON_ID=46948 /ORGANISM="Rhodomonas abbreviata, Strain Caron Lab Isolate" /LENGTH=321 /DNA_ID=CAMNT_0023394147 /DNA_START=62 /DNA_END=1027 /DNA_ORIENTATION=-
MPPHEIAQKSNTSNASEVLRRGFSVREAGVRRIRDSMLRTNLAGPNPVSTLETFSRNVCSWTAPGDQQGQTGSTDSLPGAVLASSSRIPDHGTANVLDIAESSDARQPERNMAPNESKSPDSRKLVVGMPLPMGTAVQCVSRDKKATDKAVMSSIQADTYKFVRHMIILGWSYGYPKNCAFSVTINETGRFRDTKEEWSVSQANPLHYAVSCGSLNAAAALIVGFPELARGFCVIEIATEGEPTCTSNWTALDLASYFAKLYSEIDQTRHESYQKASLVLLHLLHNPSRLPYLHHGTAKERLLAAGKDPRVVAAAFEEAIG